MKVLFVNENMGGHRAMHMYLRQALLDRTDVDAEFFDVPPPRFFRRLIAAPVPGLRRSDSDLQPLRLQLAQSALVRRRMARWPSSQPLHVYTHNVALLAAGPLRSHPTVVSTDCTNVQNATTLPYRLPGRGTAVTLALTRRFESRVYAAATFVVAQSAWAADSLRNDYRVDAERVRVIPFGVTLPPAPSYAVTDPPEVTYAGTSMDRKGGWALLRAWKRHLAHRSRLNLVTREPVPEHEGVTVFPDIRPGDGRFPAVLDRTAVFAFPSVIDKSSYAVLEAQASGVPVVAYRSGAIAELIEDGVTGMVVDAGDEEALAAAIEAVLDDPARRLSMARAARARVEELFDARVTTAALVQALQDAVDVHEKSAS